MNILLIADPHIPVPPSHYGGAERIVHLYAQEFARLGHSVHLMAGPGSQAYGGRLHVHHAPSLAYASRAHRKIQFQLQSLLAAGDCDVVYNFGRFDYLEALLRLRKPMLCCFQNPLDQRQIDFAEQRIRANVAFHCLSESQKHSLEIRVPTVTIPNPIDCGAYQCGSGQGGYLAFLGRLTHNKGVDVAIAAARKAGKKLVIAGNVSNEPGGPEFFRDQVEPWIDGDQIRWLGPVTDQGKQDLLANAEALLFPIRWEEPFGIVMVEALACGCPVIATRRASTPEVIDDAVTGLLCDPPEPSADVFAEAVKRLPFLSRQDCRDQAEQRFDVRILAPKALEGLRSLSVVHNRL